MVTKLDRLDEQILGSKNGEKEHQTWQWEIQNPAQTVAPGVVGVTIPLIRKREEDSFFGTNIES